MDPEVLPPPGEYGDGPVHIRVEKGQAGAWRPPPGHDVVCNDWRCRHDPEFDYVEVVNTHNAFLYVERMIERGVPSTALSVVRLPPRNGAGGLNSGARLGQLRAAAMVLADHGWPVVRGTYFDAGEWHGKSGSVGLRPMDEDWTVDPDEAARRWASKPYSLLLACGEAVDCLQVPAGHGARMLAALAAACLRPPAMVTLGQLSLFVRTNDHSYPALMSATWCTLGTCVGLPPSGQHDGRRGLGYHWVPGLSPDRLGWRLPDLAPVYEVIAKAASRSERPTTTDWTATR